MLRSLTWCAGQHRSDRGTVNFVDLSIGASALCYLFAAAGLAVRGQWFYAAAFLCWAGANVCLLLIAGGLK